MVGLYGLRHSRSVRYSPLFAHADDRYAVMVCKHDYVPVSERKFLNKVQTAYKMKNWSSVILMNNARCKALTPDFVNHATGLELHQFKWLASEYEIGSLDLDWNWLVGEYPKKDDARVVHFTLGGPYFNEYKTQPMRTSGSPKLRS